MMPNIYWAFKGTKLSADYVPLSIISLPTTPWSKYHYCFHFADEETESPKPTLQS